ncbi:helix-turn-helix domain-containing protein [Caldimonas sp.]|uniref:helix-turn-helix domain-containing protein n=1 Tax=Caldimonas sp. TaxID=2838790 RepID=UPI003919D458
MTEGQTAQGPTEPSAGEMIRAARLAQGVHIAQLAASIKVSVRKLEALEADRLDELPDATFARALAQTVCRSLKIDPAPVLALLPSPGTLSQLEEVAQGLNQPFRDPAQPREGLPGLGLLRRPAVWGAALLMAGSMVLWWIPTSTWQTWLGRDGAATTSGVTVEVVPVEPAASLDAPASDAEAASAPAAVSQASVPAPSAPPVVVRTRAESWVEIQDANGRTLLSRLLAPGEEVALEGAFPMRVRVGNADATELRVRGEVFDMTPFRRENVARFDIR